MWNAGQKKTFAKDIIQIHFNSSALKYLTGQVREAVVAAHCFQIIRGQHAESVKVEAMDDLLNGVREAIEAKLGYRFFED